MKRLLGILLVVALLAMSAPMALAGAEGLRTFVDSAGRTVTLPAQIDRIAPSGKVAHIVLYALAPDAFSCLSNAWTKDAAAFFPEETLNLPVVGQFYGESALNLEALAQADPDVIIDIGEPKQGIADDMDAVQAQLGIPTVFIEANAQHMGDCYRMLGELLTMPEEAEAIAAYCDELYAKTGARMAEIGEAGMAKVLYCLGDDGLNVIAKGSYHAEIIDMMADNLAVIDSPSSKASGDAIDMEQLLLWEPDFVLFAPDVNVELVLADAGWQSLGAIQAGQYAQAPAGPFNWMGFPPSVNRYMGMMWMGHVLYPEVFSEDLYEQTKAYYEMFYHFELSPDKFAEILKG